MLHILAQICVLRYVSWLSFMIEEKEIKLIYYIPFELEAFNNYVDRILDFFDHPPTPCRQMKKKRRGHSPYRRRHLTNHPPTPSCLRSYWMPPYGSSQSLGLVLYFRNFQITLQSESEKRNMQLLFFLYAFSRLLIWLGKSRISWFTWRGRLASFFSDQNLSKISKKGTNII